MMAQAAARAIAQPPSPSPGHAVSNAAEAELLVNHVIDVMDTLLALVEKETELVRAGRLTEATALEESKAQLSQLYLADTERLRASRGFFAGTVPEILDALRKRHELFHALLQINLTVLATARAVSESIMRGVSDELTRKAAPQGYGVTGRAEAPAPGVRPPLTLSRVL